MVIVVIFCSRRKKAIMKSFAAVCVLLVAVICCDAHLAKLDIQVVSRPDGCDSGRKTVVGSDVSMHYTVSRTRCRVCEDMYLCMIALGNS